MSPLFPLDSAERHLSGFVSNLERGPNFIRWPSGDGVTTLRVDQVEWVCDDGAVVREVAVLSHISPQLADCRSDSLARLNRLSTLSSFVPGGPSGQAGLVSKVGIFEGDEHGAALWYAPLICSEAGVIGWHAQQLVRGRMTVDPRECPLSLVDAPPELEQADFEEVVKLLSRKGYLGSCGAKSCAVEFPWDAGAVSHAFRDPAIREGARRDLSLSEADLDRMSGRTSLLLMQIGSHPLYGPGLRCTLELPMEYERERGDEWVTNLNTWELITPDLAPHFGSWCVGERGLTYVSFLPTQYCVSLKPGYLRGLAVWMMGRAERIRAFLAVAE